MTGDDLRHRAGRTIAAVAGLALLVATATKLLAWDGRDAFPAGPWLLPAWMAAALVAWEALLGTALLLLPGHRAVRAAAGATFAAFAGAGILVLRADGDCGCFGVWSPPSWAIVAFDLAVLAGGLAFPSRAGAAPGPRRLAPPLAAALAALAVFAAGRAGTPSEPPPTSSPPPAIATPRLPAALARGTWLVCCHRHGCARCGTDLPLWIALARAPRDDGWRWAFLNLDPAGTADLLAGRDLGAAKRLRSPDPWIETPLFLRVVDGRIVAAGRDPAAILPP